LSTDPFIQYTNGKHRITSKNNGGGSFSNINTIGDKSCSLSEEDLKEKLLYKNFYLNYFLSINLKGAMKLYIAML
jgi:hypothetical protein